MVVASDSRPEGPLSEADVEILAAAHPEIGALVLFGSRAIGEARPGSDWDFGVLPARGQGEPDLAGLHRDLSLLLSTDALDLVDLTRASGLLRFRCARDGRMVFEQEAGVFHRFWLDAVRFWFDAEHVVAPALERFMDEQAAGVGS